MQTTHSQAHSPKWLILVVTLTLLATALFGTSQRAYAAAAVPSPQSALLKDGGGDDGGGDDHGDDIKVYARVVSRPDGTNIGSWTIGDKNYTVNEQTIISTLHGPLTINGCVEVEVASSAPTLAKELGSEEDSKCSTLPGDDSGGDDNGGDDNSDDIKVYARVVSRPDGTNIGTWVIGDKSYTVNEQTIISTLHGPFTINGCVEVEVAPSAPTIAKELGSEEDSKCSTLPGDDDSGGDDKGGDDDVLIDYGYLVSRPEGKAGTWVVDNASYTAGEQTELETEHGALAVGICVKVKSPIGNPTFAKEIESEEDYKCSGRGDDDSSAEGKLYGLVESLPADGRAGLWVIGGKSISATAQTIFNSEGSVFAVGSLVKVEFYTTGEDTHVAKEIELKYESSDDSSRDSMGKLYGLVESRPQGTLQGIWKIGSVEYLADGNTEFSGSDFAVGDRVKVKYVVQSDNSRRATEIERTDDNGGTDDSGHVKIIGFVESKPAGFVGTWVIAGAEFQADPATLFHEDDGLFAVGAYVEVEYQIVNNARLAKKMETRVPPGAGDTTRFGAINRIDDNPTVATVSAVTASGWTIGGQSYVVGAATDLDGMGSDLAVGSEVMVNSYVANNGLQMATQIRAVTLDQTLLLPLALR